MNDCHEPTSLRPPLTPRQIRRLRRAYAVKLRFFDRFNRLVCRVWYRLRRIGPCTIPPTGSVIVTANHTCAADPLMICAGCDYRKVSFMIAEEFANIPVGGWFVRLIDCIPVRRERHDTAATKAAIRRLRDGHVLGIFIQGRIPAPGEDVKPKDGVALLALRSGATVIPVHLSGNKYKESIAAGLVARHRTRVRFGPPVDLSVFAGMRSRRDLAQATTKIFQSIQELAPEAGAPTI